MMAGELWLKAGQLAELVNNQEIARDRGRKIAAAMINEFRVRGVIPPFLVDGSNGQRRYHRNAAEWVEFALLVKRHGGDATYEKIGKIFSVALAKWGEKHGTLRGLKDRFDSSGQAYPAFVRELLDRGLNLPDDVVTDAVAPKR